MKAKLDREGRLTIPAKIRRDHGIDQKSELEIISTDEGILIRVAEKQCIICKSTKDLKQTEHLTVCQSCIKKLINKI